MSSSQEPQTPDDTWRPSSPIRRRKPGEPRDIPTRLDVRIDPSRGASASHLEAIRNAEQTGLSTRLENQGEINRQRKKQRAQQTGQTASDTASNGVSHSSVQQTPADLLQGFEALRLDKPLTNNMSGAKGITFHGKASTLEDVLTSVEIQQAAQGAETDRAKSVVLAATFRGKALTWLSQQRKITPDILDDYDEFVAQVKTAFDLPDETKRALATKQFRNIRQTKSVQDYAVKFQQLQQYLGIPEETAISQFVHGLKSHVRNVLIVNDEMGTLSEAINEATRVDARMFSERGYTRYKGQGGKSQGQSGIKCNSCGRFGHKAANCKVKPEY